ncbi:uncharacterized protein LOC143464870 isoform X1 [Clavelina lepadiformis]|uniref:uncharacterized protein LOC143464870 isoform X1 n=1 Tax=Clavelina lepadiformis TaxID=159417 RepID=UPI004042170D
MDIVRYLPHHDVVFPKIFCHFNIETLFQLRLVSKCWESLVTEYFKQRRNLDLSEFGQRMTVDAFLLMTSNNKVLKQLLVPEATSWLMDKHLLPVIRNCSHVLTDIDLSNCSQLSSLSLHSLAANCRNLTKVSLKGCAWVDEDDFKQLAINNRGLRKIDVSRCWSVDDRCLMNAAISCPFLEEIILSYNLSVTDSALVMIAMKCKGLKHLSVIGCWYVSICGIRWVFDLFIANDLNTNIHLLLFDAFRAIVDHCKDLKILHASDCLRMNEACLSWLRVRGVAVDVCQCHLKTH